MPSLIYKNIEYNWP